VGHKKFPLFLILINAPDLQSRKRFIIISVPRYNSLVKLEENRTNPAGIYPDPIYPDYYW
jgi:hypothetical protein